MTVFSNITNTFKVHSYSIITAILIGLLTTGYLVLVLPKNIVREDAHNAAIFKGIKDQLQGYIDDRVNRIDNTKVLKTNGNGTFRIATPNPKNPQDSVAKVNYYINGIKIVHAGFDKDKRTIIIERNINLTIIVNSTTVKKQPITDVIEVDLSEFLKRISTVTNFNSFYVCPVDAEGKCQLKIPLLSQQVSLKDQQSLSSKCRDNGPFDFKESANRYYADQFTVPETNFTLFLAAGVQKNYFQTSVREIKSGLLIFCLLLTIVLILSISFIKPIISSYRERLFQMDLVSVVFSIGALTAVLVVFGMVSFWNTALKTRTQSDLENLVSYIDTSFNQQIRIYDHWKNNPNSQFYNAWNAPGSQFSRIITETKGKTTTTSGEPIAVKFPQETSADYLKIQTKGQSPADLRALKNLDAYFRMNRYGLITTNLNKDSLGLRRKYSNRTYFRMITKDTMDRVLTAVLSRETDEYQWIYAQRYFSKADTTKSKNDGITGIAFRTDFSKKIQLPPGTDYMLVDRRGEVLMQNDPKKNLYQNLLQGSEKNSGLMSLLAGIQPASFTMDYQGVRYQVYAKKLSIRSDFPVYIVGVRDLSFVDRLSLFSFGNGFVIAILYGMLVLSITLLYSALFYSGRISFFSRKHFNYLFPDGSRTYEYKRLFIVNVASILCAVTISLFTSPSTALYCCALFGINTGFINLVTLNTHVLDTNQELKRLLGSILLFGIGLPMLFLMLGQPVLAGFALFSGHIVLILHYRKQEGKQKAGVQFFVDKNHGVNRKAYAKVITAMLFNHFAVFPFILCSAIYVTEINEFSRYYYSKPQITEKAARHTINAYGCEPAGVPRPLFFNKALDDTAGALNLGFLMRPAKVELARFSFAALESNYFLSSRSVFNTGIAALFFLSAGFILLIWLMHTLLNYYSNRFFFYDLMQASHEGYYPCTIHPYASNAVLLTMIDATSIKLLIQDDLDPDAPAPLCTDRKIPLREVFDKDTADEINPALRTEFILISNQKECNDEYLEIWSDLRSDELRNVLFDFAQDNFVNYKNKDMLMELLELGIIDRDRLTGRLKVMSISFRNYIVCRSQRDEEFIKKFEEESKNGTFGRLKFPILIMAVSVLLLLMYLNKDSYDRVALISTSIGSALVLVDKLLAFTKRP